LSETRVPNAVASPDDPSQDLGIGDRVLARSRVRFLNPDGSFNVVREGLPFWRSLSLYHWLLSISWPAFFLVVSGGYFATNLAFAVGYLLCGPDALQGLSDVTNPESRFWESYFFSVHTLATIGYGTISPKSMPAHLLVTLEALVGLLGFALATGLLFARFSRPSARILYSSNAVVAPYREGTALMFRIANARSSQLIDVRATVSLGWLERIDGKPTRRFHELGLERRKVDFFPLHWVVVHPIDERSPLRGITREQLAASGAEVYVMITGVDEMFSQPVFSRTSYRAEDVVFGHRFSDIFIDPGAGRVGIDLRRLHDIEPAG
jgi:inward rectifier potassium channel